MNKKFLGISLVSVVTFLVMLPSVFAYLENNILFDWVRNLFSDPTAQPWVLKFFLFWLLFALIFVIGGKIDQLKTEKGGKGPVTTIAIVLALMGSIPIPNETIITIYNLYGGIFQLLLLLLPIFIAFKVIKKDPEMGMGSRLIYAFILLVLGILMMSGWFLEYLPDTFHQAVNDPLEIIGMVMFVLGIFQIFYAIQKNNQSKPQGGGGVGASLSRGFDNVMGGKDRWNDWRDRRGEKKDAKNAKKEQNEAKRLDDIEKLRAETESLGHFIGKNAADAGKRIETLKDGVEKLDNVVNSGMVEKMHPEINSVLVEPLYHECEGIIEDLQDNARKDSLRDKELIEIGNKLQSDINDEKERLVSTKEKISDEANQISELQKEINDGISKKSLSEADTKLKEAQQDKLHQEIIELNNHAKVVQEMEDAAASIMAKIKTVSIPVGVHKKQIERQIMPLLDENNKFSIPSYLNAIHKSISDAATKYKDRDTGLTGMEKGLFAKYVNGYKNAVIQLDKDYKNYMSLIEAMDKDIAETKELFDNFRKAFAASTK